MTHPSRGNIIVYQATNLKNNKIYIGSTIKTLKETQWHHKHCANKGDSRPIYQAMNKYGFYNFIYNIMGEFQSKEQAYEFKEVCVEEFNAMNPKYGYNCTTGSLDKYTMNKETREKISKTQEGKVMPESWKIWLKDQIKNNPNKYKSFKKGYKHTEEARENMRSGQFNSSYIHTEEHKRKIGLASKELWSDKKFKQKMIKKHKEIGQWKGKNNPWYGKGKKGKDNPMYGRRGSLHPSYGTTISKEQINLMQKGQEKYREKRRKEALARTEKKCNKCNQILHLSLFYKNKNSLDGSDHHCKVCDKKKKEKYDTSK